MRLICISDTHGFHRQLTLPAGDVLIHCGDITMEGETDVLVDFRDWLAEQPHEHKIILGGNHDLSLDMRHARLPKVGGHQFFREAAFYLEGDSLEIEGVHFYGWPWVPELRRWAFYEGNTPSHRIPVETNVLISHGPPRGILDDCGPHVGSERLLEALFELPRLHTHVFGHIHECHGWAKHAIAGRDVKFVNAAICTREYKPTNAPLVVEI